MGHLSLSACWFVVSALVLPLQVQAQSHDSAALEPRLRDSLTRQLETLERRQLHEADAIFENRPRRGVLRPKVANYGLAAIAYERFCRTYPHSPALSYALVRQGRALHLDNNPKAARLIYDEVIEFFRYDTPMAAAALYFKGLSYKQDQNMRSARRAWALIAKNREYRQQPLAALALRELAEFKWDQGRPDEALADFKNIAITFRQQNEQVALQAIDRVLTASISMKRDLGALYDFNKQVHGFEQVPQKQLGELDSDRLFWDALRKSIRRLGSVADKCEADRRAHFAYWAKQMRGRCLDWDVFQKDVADFYFLADGNRRAWVDRLDKQYDSFQRDDGPDRIIRWMEWLAPDRQQVMRYMAKLRIEKLRFAQVMRIVRLWAEDLKDPRQAALLVTDRRLPRLADADAIALANVMYPHDRNQSRRLLDALDDREKADWVWLKLIANDPGVALEVKEAVAAALADSKRYGAEMRWIMGMVYKQAKRYASAITSFHASNRYPDAAIEVVDCHLQKGELKLAMIELLAVESLFGSSRDSVKALERLSKAMPHLDTDAQRKNLLLRKLRIYKPKSASLKWSK